jgi:hypothetical protein
MQERGRRNVRPMTSPAGIARRHVIGRRVSFIVCYATEFQSEFWCSRNNQSACKDIMKSVLKVVKIALKLLILGWVVAYDKYKTALVSDPHHQIARVDFLRP